MNRQKLQELITGEFLETLRTIEYHCNTILVNKGELQLFVKWCHNIAGKEYVPELERPASTKENQE